MKKLKSRIALLLVPVLVTGILSGCAPRIQVMEDGSPGVPGTGGSTQQAGGQNQQAAAGGGSEAAGSLAYADGTTLRMATGYNSVKTGLTLMRRPQGTASPWQTARPTMQGI